MQQNLKYFQLELVNREQNYNALFSSNPTVGVLDPFSGTTSTRSAHSGLKVNINFSCLDNHRFEAQEPAAAPFQRQFRQNGAGDVFVRAALQPTGANSNAAAKARQAQKLKSSIFERIPFQPSLHKKHSSVPNLHFCLI